MYNGYQAYCEYVRLILVSLFDSQTTVLRFSHMAVECGVERTFSSLRSTQRTLAGGFADTQSRRAIRPSTGQIWEAVQPIRCPQSAPSEQGREGPLSSPALLLLPPLDPHSSIFDLGLVHSSAFLQRGQALYLCLFRGYMESVAQPSRFLLNFSKSVPLIDAFHHFTCPLLELSLLDFSDSSCFYFVQGLYHDVYSSPLFDNFFIPNTVCLCRGLVMYIQIHTHTHTHTFGEYQI